MSPASRQIEDFQMPACNAQLKSVEIKDGNKNRMKNEGRRGEGSTKGGM